MATKKVQEKVIKKVNEEIEEPEVTQESKINQVECWLKKIFYCLIAIIALLLLGVIGIFAGIDNKLATTSSQEDEYQTPEYDVSMFTQITADEFVDAYNSSKTSVIYIGRPTCGYCAAFLPALKQAQKDFGYTTLYLDIDQVSSSDISKITSLNEWLDSYYGTTPLVVVVKDGKFVGEGWIGYSDYENFATYLENLGFTKEK